MLFSAGLGSVRFIVGLDDPKWFYDSTKIRNGPSSWSQRAGAGGDFLPISPWEGASPMPKQAKDGQSAQVNSVESFWEKRGEQEGAVQTAGNPLRFQLNQVKHLHG